MTDKNMVLVEGPEDWNVFLHLIKHHYNQNQVMLKLKGSNRLSVDENINNIKHILFDIVQGDSAYKVKPLSARLKASGLERVGIVVDADANVQVRWNALRMALMTFGYSHLPEMPDPTGTIIEESGYPIVGVWIMPNNALPGKLEDFVQFLVPTNDPLWARATQCVQQIPISERRFTEQAMIKAYIHTWLAWQKEPGTPMGQAITKRYLDATSLHSLHLMDWLRRLFDLDGEPS